MELSTQFVKNIKGALRMWEAIINSHARAASCLAYGIIVMYTKLINNIVDKNHFKIVLATKIEG